jgi:hypothetical protein
MSVPEKYPYFDPALERRVLAAEAQHQRRRRRARWIYTFVDHLFYPALLLGAILAIKAFMEFVVPYLVEM